MSRVEYSSFLQFNVFLKPYATCLRKNLSLLCLLSLVLSFYFQETKFKNYYHQLHWVMKLYHEVCEKVPKPLKKLMSPLTESILYYLHPGLSTLTWSSLNIDAYLHQVFCIRFCK